jgi:tetratricopeptide (TPR) repeat protein
VNAPRHAASRLRRELAALDHGFDADRVLATLHGVLDEPETATSLLAEIWPVVPPGADHDFIRRLSDVGARMLTALPTSLLLAAAFRRAARTLRAQDQLRLAALHGMRELAIRRHRDDDPVATAEALLDLATTYRAQGRLHKVVGCADEILETYLLHEHQAGTADALVHLGTLMIEVGRHGSAINYLSRADKLFGDLADRSGRARCLPELGRALWLTGNPAQAHREFNRALALLIGTDDTAAQRVRDLRTDLESRPPVTQQHDAATPPLVVHDNGLITRTHTVGSPGRDGPDPSRR